MNSRSFDNWTRNRALRLSRRDTLRLAGIGGAAAALPMWTPPALAQGSCSLTVHAETDGGPSAPKTYDGTLQFTLSADGTFSQASFTGAQSVTGSATGRAIDFEVTLAGNQTLAFLGAGDQPIAICQGNAAGIFTGPQPGDLGAWQAMSSAGSGSSSGSTAPPPAAGQSGSGSSGGSDSGSDSNGGGGSCLESQSQCNASAECCSGWCTDNECRTCSDTICGEDCAVLSDNLAHCGACFNPCNVDTETCVDGVCTAGNGGTTCLPDAAPCASDTDCCAKQCHFGVCGCAKLGQSCSDFGEQIFSCCEGTPVLCFSGACCIINGFACSADADCCEYINGTGFCTNGICTRTA